MKGVVLDAKALNPGDLSFDRLMKMADFEVHDNTPDDLVLDRCAGRQVVITNKVPFDRRRMEALASLKYIGVTATGYNIIDIEAARELGIAVTNIPSYSTDAVAQHVFAFILEVSNAVALHDKSVKEGQWERSDTFCYWKTPLFELAGKRLGIVGLGNIGRCVASIAKAFAMDVVSYSPHSRMEGVKAVDLDTLMSTCDIITLHCPLNAQTRGIVCDESLSRVKPGAILINASRGPLVEEDAVIRALESGRLSRYCADVLDVEPPRGGSRLAMHPASIITPHIAWAPLETRRRLLSIVEDNLEAFLKGEKLNRVDL